MFKSDPYIEFLELLKAQESLISRFYDGYIKKAARILVRCKRVSEGSWENKVRMQWLLSQLLLHFQRGFFPLLERQVERAQALAYRQINGLVGYYNKGINPLQLLRNKLLYGMGAGSDIPESISDRLSDRVWQLTGQTRNQIEIFLKEGFAQGRSAIELTRDLRQFLKEPDQLFRRIRNEKGALELSKAAREYRPGRGVYRSSYKNALRLARTQINMAYHRAEYERWQKLPFVLGIEVRLSKVHKQGGCICDHLQGRYPKNFLFLGWHPQCLCQAVPVMLSRDEFIQFSKTGRIDPCGYIREIPKKAQEYLDEHAEQIRGWKNKPYFIEDNFKYVQGKGFVYKGL